MIPKSDAALVLEKALDLGADFAELFMEDRRELNIAYKGTCSGVTRIHLYGVGLYLIRGTRSVYTYANDISLPALLALCRRGCSLLTDAPGQGGAIPPFATVAVAEPNPVILHPATVGHGEKIKLLADMDRAVMASGGDVKNLPLDYFDTDQQVTIANTEGVWAEDRRVTSRIRMVPVVVHGGESVGHFSDFTRPMGFEAFQGEDTVAFALETVDEMRALLRADDAPAGYMPVVFAPGGCTGTFFHEACGHQFETRSILGGGVFAGKIGTQVASPKVTLVDDGTLPHAYGSSKYDDEGMPRQKNVLIENGIMKSYLSDRLGALRLDTPRTGSGRRQGYAFAPGSRMSNTYLAAGTDDLDEMIRSMGDGLYVTKIGGGSGGTEFTLAAQKAFLVKNGQLDRQVKGALLLGRGDQTMLKIDRVGSEVVFERGGAFCGSVSGLCNTTTSGASMRVEGMLIGGKGGK